VSAISLNWLQLEPGDYEVCFGDVPGFDTPACEQVVVTAGATATVVGDFEMLGLLAVSTDPAVESTIRVNGLPRDDWGLWLPIPPGVHEVCFSVAKTGQVPVEACQTATVTAGQTTSAIGLFGSGGTAAAIAAGWEHTCAVLPGGTVKCWGVNTHGQLGDGTETNRKTPVTVTGLTGVTAVDASFWHTCAVAGGAVSCWGMNNLGQLGDGTTTSSSAPVSVAGITGATAVAAGGGFTCALEAGGSVKCWGSNVYGQLGDGGVAGSSSSAPVSVAGITGATAVAAGGGFTCALEAGGSVKCWGSNVYGQLGDGTTTDAFTPVTVAGLTGVTAITAGENHTCASEAGGSVKCWGWNIGGQLGDGSTTNRKTPVTVVGLTGGAGIAAGELHSCASVAGGSLKCWGNNTFGQLGDGTGTDSLTPVTVTTLTGVTAVAAGGPGHTCALASGGTVACWGRNDGGQLGDGTTADSWTPGTVIGL
jgi:alpha-tubulin suppressor-like RCC1 family protein